jgi:Rhomboid family
VFPLRDNVSRTHEPVVVWAIIALNAVAFAYQLTLGPRDLQMFLYQHALVPVRYFSPSWAWQVGLSPTDFRPFLTNTFLHGGFLHIILNMWTLWIFGPALEDRLGPVRFAALYLLAGIAASATHAIFNATSPMPLLGIGRDLRNHRGLRCSLPLCLGPRSGPHCVHSVVLQRACNGVRRHLVLHAGTPGRERALLALCRRWHRMVGPHRWLRIRVAAVALA